MTHQEVFEVLGVLGFFALYMLWPIIRDGSYKAHDARIAREDGKCEGKE